MGLITKGPPSQGYHPTIFPMIVEDWQLDRLASCLVGDGSRCAIDLLDCCVRDLKEQVFFGNTKATTFSKIHPISKF